MAQGWKWRGIQGDSSQMGGDFIIDRQGIIRMAHRSYEPTDRPEVKEILQALDAISPVESAEKSANHIIHE